LPQQCMPLAWRGRRVVTGDERVRGPVWRGGMAARARRGGQRATQARQQATQQATQQAQQQQATQQSKWPHHWHAAGAGRAAAAMASGGRSTARLPVARRGRCVVRVATTPWAKGGGCPAVHRRRVEGVAEQGGRDEHGRGSARTRLGGVDKAARVVQRGASERGGRRAGAVEGNQPLLH
jgi:hypothetical protein